MLTPCQCPVAGYCETHQRQMTEGLHRACRERKGYFETFQRTLREGGPQVSRAPANTTPPKPRRPKQDGSLCVNRKAYLTDYQCKACGGKTIPVPVYGCKLHRRCADRAGLSGIHDCGRCDEYESCEPPSGTI